MACTRQLSGCCSSYIWTMRYQEAPCSSACTAMACSTSCWLPEMLLTQIRPISFRPVTQSALANSADCAEVLAVTVVNSDSKVGLLGGIGSQPDDVLHMKRTADRLFGDNYRWSVLGAGQAQMKVAAMAAAMVSMPTGPPPKLCAIIER